jgi:hypothetical protein
MGKGLLDGRVAFPKLPGNKARKKAPVFLRPIFHSPKSVRVFNIRHSIPGIRPGKGLKTSPLVPKQAVGPTVSVSFASFGSSNRQIHENFAVQKLA